MKTLTRLAFLFALGIFTAHADEAKVLRLGHFPNITHAQALYAHATGEFEKAVGVPIQWSTFNAGPSAIEALFSDAIDATYIGPNPAINGYVKTEGEALRIIAGSASGGAALVILSDAGINSEKDFNDKTVATPQLGGTQDVAARNWFQSKGYKLKEKGGNLTILPISNADQLTLFQKKEIQGAWTVEPWVSRLEQEAHGKILLEEKSLWPEGKYVTTHLIVSTKFLQKNPQMIRKLLAAHVDVTQKINKDKKAAGIILNREIKTLTGKALADSVIESSLKRVDLTWDPISSSLKKSAEEAHNAGFLRESPDLAKIYDLTILNDVLKEKGLPSVQ